MSDWEQFKEDMRACENMFWAFMAGFVILGGALAVLSLLGLL